MDSELERDPVDYAFGFGRRRCPGMRFAMQSIWCSIVGLLASFDISPVTDKEGRPILPDIAFEGGAFRHPKPFTCNIRPRSNAVEDLIRGLEPLIQDL